MGSVRVLVGLWMLVPGMAISAHAAEPPAESNQPMTVDPIAPFQAWLDAWVRDTSRTSQTVREAALPVQSKPGLDLRIDPDDESVYLGWRARF